MLQKVKKGWNRLVGGNAKSSENNSNSEQSQQKSDAFSEYKNNKLNSQKSVSEGLITRQGAITAKGLLTGILKSIDKDSHNSLCFYLDGLRRTALDENTSFKNIKIIKELNNPTGEIAKFDKKSRDLIKDNLSILCKDYNKKHQAAINAKQKTNQVYQLSLVLNDLNESFKETCDQVDKLEKKLDDELNQLQLEQNDPSKKEVIDADDDHEDSMFVDDDDHNIHLLPPNSEKEKSAPPTVMQPVDNVAYKQQKRHSKSFDETRVLKGSNESDDIPVNVDWSNVNVNSPEKEKERPIVPIGIDDEFDDNEANANDSIVVMQNTDNKNKPRSNSVLSTATEDDDMGMDDDDFKPTQGRGNSVPYNPIQNIYSIVENKLENRNSNRGGKRKKSKSNMMFEEDDDSEDDDSIDYENQSLLLSNQNVDKIDNQKESNKDKKGGKNGKSMGDKILSWLFGVGNKPKSKKDKVKVKPVIPSEPGMFQSWRKAADWVDVSVSVLREDEMEADFFHNENINPYSSFLANYKKKPNVSIIDEYENKKTQKIINRNLDLDNPNKNAINQLYETYKNSKDIFDNLPGDYKRDREVTQEDVAKALKTLKDDGNWAAKLELDSFYDELEYQVEARKDLLIDEDPFREVINELFDIYKNPDDIFDNLPLKYKNESGVTRDEVENAVKEFNGDVKRAAKLDSFYKELDYQISIRDKVYKLVESQGASLTAMNEAVSKRLGDSKNGRFVMVKDLSSQQDGVHILKYSSDGRYVKKLSFTINDPREKDESKSFLTEDELKQQISPEQFKKESSEPGRFQSWKAAGWKAAGWVDVSVLREDEMEAGFFHYDGPSFSHEEIHHAITTSEEMDDNDLRGRFVWVGNSEKKALIKFSDDFNSGFITPDGKKHFSGSKMVLTPAQYEAFKVKNPAMAKDVDCWFDEGADASKRKEAGVRLKDTTKELFYDQVAEPSRIVSNGFRKHADLEKAYEKKLQKKAKKRGYYTVTPGQSLSTQGGDDDMYMIHNDDNDHEQRKLVTPGLADEDGDNDVEANDEDAELMNENDVKDFQFDKEIAKEMKKKTKDFQEELNPACGLQIKKASTHSSNSTVFKCNDRTINVKFKVEIEIDGVKGFFLIDEKGNQYVSPAKEMLKAMENNIKRAGKNAQDNHDINLAEQNAARELGRLGATFMQNKNRLEYIDVNDSLKNADKKDGDGNNHGDLQVHEDVNLMFRMGFESRLQERQEKDNEFEVFKRDRKPSRLSNNAYCFNNGGHGHRNQHGHGNHQPEGGTSSNAPAPKMLGTPQQ